MVKKLLKWSAGLLGLLVLAVGCLVALAWWRSNSALDQHYPPVQAQVDWAGGDLQRGEYLVRTRGCADCHGHDLAGGVVIDAPPFGQLVASNLTPAGVGADYYQKHLINVLRGGLDRNGQSLIFMPSHDYMSMTDAEVADMAAYLSTIPAAENPALPPMNVGPLPRVLWFFGAFPLVSREHMDLSLEPAQSIVVEASADYGAHVVSMCKGCHGGQLAGLTSPVAPDTPNPANLTPTGSMANWSEQDFFTAMREGRRPDGSQINEFMPWKTVSQMSDVEIRAIWLYLRTLPPRAQGENG